MTPESLEGFNDRALTLRVLAQERWRDVERRLRVKGFTLGWPPATGRQETFGELLEARAEGLRSCLYGDLAANCIGVEAVLANGQPVASKIVPRSAAGPDWKYLLLGGQSLTGRISSATLRVYPVPATVVVRTYTLPPVDAVRALADILHRGAIPAVAALVPEAGQLRLLLTFEGEARLCQARADIAHRFCRAAGATPLDDGVTSRWVAAADALFQGATDAHPEEAALLLEPSARLEAGWALLPRLIERVMALPTARFCVTHARHASAALLIDAAGIDPSVFQALLMGLEAAGGRRPLHGLTGPLGRLMAPAATGGLAVASHPERHLPEGPRHEGSRHEGSRHEGSRHEGPRHDGHGKEPV